MAETPLIFKYFVQSEVNKLSSSNVPESGKVIVTFSLSWQLGMAKQVLKIFRISSGNDFIRFFMTLALILSYPGAFLFIYLLTQYFSSLKVILCNDPKYCESYSRLHWWMFQNIILHHSFSYFSHYSLRDIIEKEIITCPEKLRKKWS